MNLYHIMSVMVVGLSVVGCTSDPNAPVNQAFPIRQMDQFFGSIGTPQPRTQAAIPAYTQAPDYTHQPGYLPAYPPY